MPAHARGGGGEVRERERQKETEIITNQRDCARSARDGGGVGAGRGPFPGGARRWEVALTKRNTTPVWTPDAPKPPSPTPPPNTRERHGPPPHSDNRRRHSLLLPAGRHTRLGTPWARHSPPSQRSPAWRRPRRDFLVANTSPPTTRRQPPPRKKWLQRRGPSGERGTPDPLGEKTTQSRPVSSQSAAGQRPPEQRCREGQEHPFPDMLQRSPSSLGREMAQN